MNKPKRVPLALLAGTSLAAFGLGYVVAPKNPLDREVRYTGLASTSTTQVLSATVESLKGQNKLLVFSYKGTATVTAKNTELWLFEGRQNLIVPAVVNYYLDLSELSLADVSFDEKAKLVKVKLPQLQIGDIAFQPESATTQNGGLLTFSDEQVEELRKLNYKTARRAMVQQAQSKALVGMAKRQAQTNIASYFEIPLRIVGQPDVKVVATFK